MKTAIMLHGKPSYEEYCNPASCGCKRMASLPFRFEGGDQQPSRAAFRSRSLGTEIVRLGRLIDTSR